MDKKSKMKTFLQGFFCIRAGEENLKKNPKLELKELYSKKFDV